MIFISYSLQSGMVTNCLLLTYKSQCPDIITFKATFLCFFFFLSQLPDTNELTLKCLSIGTPKIINFPFVSNGKLMVFRCPNIQAHYKEAVLCLNFGTPENNEFFIWDKWKIYF